MLLLSLLSECAVVSFGGVDGCADESEVGGVVFIVGRGGGGGG